MRHRPYPYAIVPKTPLRVGCGCILYCMETRCIGCMLQLYMHLASSRLARQAIQPIQPIQLYSYTRYTAYSTIQPPSGRGMVAEVGNEVDHEVGVQQSSRSLDRGLPCGSVSVFGIRRRARARAFQAVSVIPPVYCTQSVCRTVALLEACCWKLVPPRARSEPAPPNQSRQHGERHI